LPYHLGILFFRQIWNTPNKKDIRALLKATILSIKGFRKAFTAAWKHQKNAPLLPENYNYQVIYSYEL
jgi:hypothetical protein